MGCGLALGRSKASLGMSMLSAAKSMLAAASPVKWGSGSGGRTRTLAAQAPHLSPADNFMEMLEAAEARDTDTLSKLKMDASFVTPQQPKSVSRIHNTHELTPPGAPKSGRTVERTVEQAREFLDSCAKSTKAAALFASAEIAKATKAAAASTKKALDAAARAVPTRTSKPVTDPAAAGPAAAAPAAAAAAKRKVAGGKKPGAPAAVPNPQAKKGKTAGAVKPAAAAPRQRKPDAAQPKAQPKAPLSPRARAAAETAAKQAAAGTRPAAKGGAKRAGASDPLVRHGYTTQGPIAAGAFSTIVRAIAVEGGHEVAVKSFDNAKCRKDYQHLYLREGELAALRTIKKRGNNKWIANMIEEHVGPAHTYAILEYCAGGSLQRHLQKLTSKPRDRDGNYAAIPEADCAYMGAQINAALVHLHSLDVAHRDLKPGNILFAGDRWLKVCDFGFAKRCKGQRLHTLCGTPIYMAPELTMDQSKKGYKGHPVDMWAFGALLYEMMHNKIAFNGVSEQQLHQRIRSGTHAPLRKDLSSKATKLLKSMLRIDPDKRISSREAADQGWFAPLTCTARTARVHPPPAAQADAAEYDA